MVRRAIQASAFDLGVPDDRAHQKLHQQIDGWQRRAPSRRTLKELAHELRFFGNDGAHPDRDGLENVSKEDAAVALGFLERLPPIRLCPASTSRGSHRGAEADAAGVELKVLVR